MSDPVELFARFARICGEVQRKAIELENHPDRRKQLRRFSAREVAAVLKLAPGQLRGLLRQEGFPRGSTGAGRRRTFAIADVHAARAWLRQAGGGERLAAPRDRERERLPVVTFVNFKGGSGKTTSATHFAQYMALGGYRVLLVDLDPQASATALFGLAPASDVDERQTFAAWVRRSGAAPVAARSVIRPTYWPGLDLVPASIGLQHAEYELVGRLVQDRAFPFYAQLQELIDAVGDPYDVVVCDCRPDVGMLTINALITSTGLVIPVPPSMIDFASSGEFFRFMAEVAADLRGSLGRGAMRYDFVRVLTTKYRQTDRNQAEIVRWKRAFFGDAVLPEPMVDTAVLDAAGIVKETLYEFEPAGGSRRTYERGLAAMNAVNAAIEAELLAAWGRPGHGCRPGHQQGKAA